MSDAIRRNPEMTKANPGRTQEGDSNCTTNQFAFFFLTKTCIFCFFFFWVTVYVK